MVKVKSSSVVLLYAMIRKHTEENIKEKNAVFRVGGFEPPKCRDQNPMPYHLATPYRERVIQYILLVSVVKIFFTRALFSEVSCTRLQIHNRFFRI